MTKRIQSVERAIQIVAALSRVHGEISVRDIGRAIGLSKSTTHRALVTLEALGLVVKSERGYRLGLLLREFGLQIDLDQEICDLATPYLRTITKRLSETTHASVMSNYKVKSVVYEPTYRSVTRGRFTGKVTPPHASAAGKVLLASLPPDAINAYLSTKPLEPVTPHTIVDEKRFRSELQQVRLSGFAMCNQEFELGTRALSVPVRGIHGEIIAAISLSGPLHRLTSAFTRIAVKELQAAADAMLQQLLSPVAATLSRIEKPDPRPEPTPFVPRDTVPVRSSGSRRNRTRLSA
jgi:DNA-binding IclR family transcriptional regulator